MPRLCLALVVLLHVVPPASLAQPDPSGIEFVTVGSPNNPAYDRFDDQGLITGRGSTSYEFRMSKYEVTTSQWLEFYNTFKARADFVPDSVLPPPLIWGAQVDPNYSGPGTRYRLIPGNPDSGMRFTAGITWRTAARFCNWLCNNKSSSLSALDNGAYDTSTFQEPMRGVFTDQLHHNPGAAYYIPSLDEWAKASFFDPNANGGQGGWWLNQYGRDRQPVFGPPPSFGGTGETNTFFQLPGDLQYTIPLGAYAGVGSLSPWGLLDSAGATSEWTEERRVSDFGQTFRVNGGSSSAGGQTDWAYAYSAENPANRYPWDGLRIAASVPAPGSTMIVFGALCWGAARRAPKRARSFVLFVCGLALLNIPGVAIAQPDPSGIEFVTVGSPNNPAYNRDDPQGLITGRGGVPYQYRMGKYEVTTSQWLEFYNTFKARADPVPDSVLPPPQIWGAQLDPNYNGPGTRYRLIPGDPNAGTRFTAGVTWRTAARFCNWLCNGKSSALSALDNGAYDTSTFQEIGRNIFTDQLQHNPGAPYYIPSLDEWAKASFYDPNANGGQGGWWLNQYGRDRQPVLAPPPSWGGDGESNTGFVLPGNAQFQIPLGAYTEVGSVSPWGLFDTAGATSEWMEELHVNQFGNTRRYTAGSSSAAGQPDWAYGTYGADFPNIASPSDGFRVAAAIPAPSSLLVTFGTLCWGATRRERRRFTCSESSQLWHFG